jgi:hypothetical protein
MYAKQSSHLIDTVNDDLVVGVSTQAMHMALHENGFDLQEDGQFVFEQSKLYIGITPALPLEAAL